MNNRENTPAQWQALATLESLVQEIISNKFPLYISAVSHYAVTLFHPLIDEFDSSVQSVDDKDRVMNLLHTYLEKIRQLSNSLFQYKRAIRKHLLQKCAAIDMIHQKLVVSVMTISYKWPQCDPMASLVHEAVTFSDMADKRQQWHYVHHQLISRINDQDIKLVAMNVVRECRPSQYNIQSWKRMMYNSHLLDRLYKLIEDTPRAKPMDEILIDSLLQWEYYDEDFICYYVTYIEQTLEKAHSCNEKKQMLSQFYRKAEVMQPTQPAFCFNVATEETNSLPPIKEFILEVLNYYYETLEELP